MRRSPVRRLPRHKLLVALRGPAAADDPPALACRVPADVVRDDPTRFNRNYLRCLQRAGDSGVVVFEDDVIVRPDWFGRLQEAIGELESLVCGAYVLALYYSRVGLSPRGRAFCSYIASTFYGTQALYFPAASAVGFAEFLQQHLVGLGSADMVLRAWCVEHQNLYATTRALAQHMGIVTTGLAGHMHQAWNFDESWPAA